MDKKALQEQFEAIAIQNSWNINKFPAGWDGHGDDEYADDFVNGAWWGFQHQQAKVEELQKNNAWLSDVAERENKRANKLQEENVSTTVLLGKVEQKKAELQKRVDAAISNIETFFDEQTQQPTQREYANFIADVLHELKAEQALKGEV